MVSDSKGEEEGKKVSSSTSLKRRSSRDREGRREEEMPKDEVVPLVQNVKQ